MMTSRSAADIVNNVTATEVDGNENENENELSVCHSSERQLTATSCLNENQSNNHEEQHCNTIAVLSAIFVTIGLLNNLSYVIMLASAKSISEGGTAIVYIANILPALLIKLSAPYWFDKVTQHTRVFVSAVTMAIAYVVTAVASSPPVSSPADHRLQLQLIGVALVSLQCGLGEASLLAAAGAWDLKLQELSQGEHNYNSDEDHGESNIGTGSNVTINEEGDGIYNNNNNNKSEKTKGHCITAFSSGTGLAGPVGYFYVIALHQWLHWSLQSLAWLSAFLLAGSYALTYRQLLLLHRQHMQQQQTYQRLPDSDNETNTYDTMSSSLSSLQENNGATGPLAVAPPVTPTLETDDMGETVAITDTNISGKSIVDLNFLQRFKLVLRLWPYIIPLFTVYAAEYACQAGAWTAIGFPVQDTTSRSQFYTISNWLYQAGVFVSRSSGTLFPVVSLPMLWFLPGLQVLNLGVFTKIAATTVPEVAGGVGYLFYRKSVLYLLSFYTGLLGGAVYVHGYKKIVADCQQRKEQQQRRGTVNTVGDVVTVDSAYTEFCLATVSVAESLGILVADVSALFLQACLYAVHGMSDKSSVSCPIKMDMYSNH